jgi:single-strand DNA-binding protein
MAYTINEVHLKGRVGKDAETKYTGGGKMVTKFSLATGGGKKKDGSGEWPTDWHNIVVWQKEEAAGIKKGAQVELWGRITTRSWDDRETGQKRYMTEIIANDLVINGDDAPVKKVAKKNPPAARPAEVEITDEDIPF